MRPGGNYIPSYRANESRAGAGANHVVLDGTLGFDDPMEMDAGYGGGGGNQNGGGLYSDTLVTNGTNGNNSNSHRRGRGFNNNNNNLLVKGKFPKLGLPYIMRRTSKRPGGGIGE